MEDRPLTQSNLLTRIAVGMGILSLALIAVPSAQAADVTWNPPASGSGGDSSWSNGTNWGGTAPADNLTSDIAVFDGTTDYEFQPSLDAFTVRSINGLKLGGASTVALTLGTNTGNQSTDGVTPANSSTIVMADITGLAVGQQIAGNRIQLGTFITAIDSGTNTITISRPTSGGTIVDAASMTFTSSLKIGSGGISLEANTPNVANTITAPVVLGVDQEWSNSSARTLAIQGSIYLDNFTLTLTGITGSVISFNGSSGSQSIGGTGKIVVDTDGTVSFGPGTGGRQQSSFTGGVTLNNGRIALQGGNSGGGGGMAGLGTGVLTINGGSISGGGNIAGRTLAISGQVWNADMNFYGNKSVDFGAGDISLGTAGGTSRTIFVEQTGGGPTFGGVISDGTTANSIVKTGVGTAILSGANTYTGSTTVDAGTLKMSGGDDRLPKGTDLAVNGGATASVAGTFDLNGLNQSVGGLKGGSGVVQGKVTNSLTTTTSTLTVTGTSNFDGLIEDGVGQTALTKSTGGVLTLTGDHTYTGVTTISGGTLLVNGSLASGSTVEVNGGTLGGTGTIAGTINVNDGGTLAAGNSIGTLNTGTLNGYGGSTLAFELDTGLETSDLLNITGDFNLSGTNDAILTLSLFGTDQVLADGTAFTLLQYSGSWNGALFEYNGLALLDGGTLNLGLNTFQVDYNSGGAAFTLTAVAVPEPSTFVLLGMGLGALFFLRRKKETVPESRITLV